jgi:LicD family
MSACSTWGFRVSLCVLLFALFIHAILIHWIISAHDQFPRQVKPGALYRVKHRQFRFPNVPLRTFQGEKLRALRILSEGFQAQQYELLRRCTTMFREHHITYWLSGGTLMGYTWPGLETILPHDDDLDVHIPMDFRATLWSPAFYELCRGYGLELLFLRLSSYQYARREGAAVRIKLAKTDMPVLDVFFEHQDPTDHKWKKVDGWTDAQFIYNSKEQWSEEDLFPLQQIERDGITLHVPAQPLRILRQQYGPNIHQEYVVPSPLISHQFPFKVLGQTIWSPNRPYQKMAPTSVPFL